MSTIIDLHIHTKYSDGTDSLKKVLDIAQGNGLQYISITDHESMNAYKNITLMNKYKLSIISGLELHTTFASQELHLLVYGLEESHPGLRQYLRKVRQERTEIAYRTVEMVRNRGVGLLWEEVESLAGPDVAITKGHVVAALQNYGKLEKEFYYHFFHPLGEGYLPYLGNPLEKVLEMMLDLGGKPVVAHPGLVNNDVLVENLVKKYGLGLEVYYQYYGSQASQWVRKYETMARQYDIIYTGGSDYHGHITPSRMGGVHVPESVIERLLR